MFLCLTSPSDSNSIFLISSLILSGKKNGKWIANLSLHCPATYMKKITQSNSRGEVRSVFGLRFCGTLVRTICGVVRGWPDSLSLMLIYKTLGEEGGREGGSDDRAAEQMGPMVRPNHVGTFRKRIKNPLFFLLLFSVTGWTFETDVEPRMRVWAGSRNTTLNRASRKFGFDFHPQSFLD